jgi:PKD repeat protein
MKKHLILICILVMFSMQYADGTPSEGSGTEIDPYLIETLDNLLWLSTTIGVWGDSNYFLQTQDIDASDTQNWNDGEGFSPIGFGDWGFYGNYNGDYHVIDSLYINRPSSDYIALFGINDGAAIEALGVTNVNITGNKYASALVGVLTNDSTISGCYATGSVSGARFVGGLVGLAYFSTLSESYASVCVNGIELAGGLVGHNLYSTIWQSYYNYESVLINEQHTISIGALPGNLYNAWMNNNMFLDITDYLSFNGEHYLINTVEDLEKLLVFGQYSEYSFLLTNDLDLSGNLDFYIPYFSGIFSGNTHTINGLNVDIPACGNIGLFGYNRGAIIEGLGVTNLYVNGNHYVGGLAGTNDSSIIRECYVTGNVNADSYVGGLVGYNLNSTICKSSIAGCITGIEKVGGITAENYNNSTISECYVTANVSADYSVGGLAHKNDESTISDCYISSHVSGDINAGGLVAFNTEESSISNLIWNIETSGQTIGVFYDVGSSSNILGCTTAEMQLMSTYTDIGWDFVGETTNGYEDIWNIDDIANNGYPYIEDLEWALNDDIVANFTAYPVYGFSPLTVNFVDESVSQISTIIAWEWDFQNDGIIDSYEHNPDWIYNEPGSYSIRLTVYDDVSRNTSTIVKEDYIEVMEGSFIPDGSGTEDDPYLIANLDNLLWLSTTPTVWGSSIYFLQTQDIDATDTQNWNDGAGFSPIGEDPFTPFQGIYNGDKHVIDGLYSNFYNIAYVGFFGCTYGAVIEALGLTNIYMSSMVSLGGVVGYNFENSLVRECYTTGTVTGDSFVGGIVGQNDHYSTVTECYSECNVTGIMWNVGGLVGFNSWGSTVSDCYSTGDVVNDFENTGGLVGYNLGYSTICNSYSTGSVSSFFDVGGFVGENKNSEIDNCIWNTETSGYTYGVGNNTGSITNLLGKTTAEMQMMNTFTDIGWDFAGETINGSEDIWDVDCTVNYGYPYILSIIGLHADFRAIPAYGIAPLSVDFIDESELQYSAIVTWEWDFENDGIIDSYEQEPSWIYTEPGLYSVCLTVYDEIIRNTSTSVKEDYIAVIDQNFVPEGNGTEDDPYLIANLDNLSWLSAYQAAWESSVYILQIQDIDATDTQSWHNEIGFSPIGLSSLNPFQGYYNGANHVIDGLFINRHEDSFIGLFGCTSGAVIEALGVTNVVLAGNFRIGGLVGCNDESSISDCYSTGNVTGSSYIGGLVGQNCNYSTVTECYSECNATGISLDVGGLVGCNNEYSSISDSYATGSVGENYHGTGGLVAYNNRYSSISKCFSTGSVSGNTLGTAGFVGDNRGDSQIADCIWNTETSGQIDGVGGNSGDIINLLGKTTAEMQMISTFTDIDWDFAGEIINGTEDLWDINSILNNGYPFISGLEWSLCNILLANFAATPTAGMLPLTVNFFDGSVSGNPITSWQWDFENDGVIDSYEQNPTWVYNEPGVFSVSLTVSNDIERDIATELKENYIEVFNELHYGDINNNSEVDSYDAALLLMYIVGLDPLPEDPVPWQAWRLLWADVDVNGEVDAQDAAHILQYVVGIITEFPVTRLSGNPEIVLSLSNDSEYIYVSSDKEIISLEYKIIECRNLIAGNAETEREDCLYYQHEQHLALISAEGISGDILKIPYERIGNADCSLVFAFECNGFIENIDYTLTDPIHFVTRLNSIYPNPFNPVTNICFEIGEDSDVLVIIYNLRGQKVETLADSYYETGRHSLIWDAENYGSGIYFISLKTSTIKEVKKITLIK